MVVADFRLLNQARKFNPGIFLSFASPYAAQVSWILGKPHIVLDDTEHARFGHMFYKPFSEVFLNPDCFKKDFGSKQVHFKSFTELFYLHRNYYSPGKDVLSMLNIRSGEKYALLRFVSWEANHDIGHTGLSLAVKKQILTFLLDHGYKVFISSESDKTDPFFRQYLITAPPECMHDVLNYCEMFISESGTMASEAAILGKPVIYVNSLPLMGYLEEQQKAGLLFHFNNSGKAFESVKALVKQYNLRETFQEKAKEILKNKIDPTLFLVWFVENYPGSVRIIKENPDYQERFI
jgi:predicted glycosyltransferase